MLFNIIECSMFSEIRDDIQHQLEIKNKENQRQFKRKISCQYLDDEEISDSVITNFGSVEDSADSRNYQTSASRDDNSCYESAVENSETNSRSPKIKNKNKFVKYADMSVEKISKRNKLKNIFGEFFNIDSESELCEGIGFVENIDGTLDFTNLFNFDDDQTDNSDEKIEISDQDDKNSTLNFEEEDLKDENNAKFFNGNMPKFSNTWETINHIPTRDQREILRRLKSIFGDTKMVDYHTIQPNPNTNDTRHFDSNEKNLKEVFKELIENEIDDKLGEKLSELGIDTDAQYAEYFVKRIYFKLLDALAHATNSVYKRAALKITGRKSTQLQDKRRIKRIKKVYGGIMTLIRKLIPK